MTGLLAVLMLALPAAAAPVQSDAKREELKGPVQSAFTEFMRKGEDIKETVSNETFDRAGNLIERKTNRVDFIKTDKPERKAANMTIFHSTMGSTVEVYKFDANGNIIEKAEYFGESVKPAPDDTTRYKRDANGRVIEEDFIVPNSKGVNVRWFKRDAAGNVTSEERAIGDIKPPYPHSDYTYVFDAHGNWIKRTEVRSHYPADAYFYGTEGTLFRTITYDATAPKH